MAKVFFSHLRNLDSVKLVEELFLTVSIFSAFTLCAWVTLKPLTTIQMVQLMGETKV